MSINTTTPACDCEQDSAPVATALFSALGKPSSVSQEFDALTQHAIGLAGLFPPGTNNVCMLPNPPKWCWAAATNWVRDRVFRDLAGEKLGPRELGLAVGPHTTLSSVLPFVLRAAADRQAFEAIDHAVALDAAVTLQGAMLAARYVEGSRWEKLCRERPWAKICQLIVAHDPPTGSPVPELVAVNLAHHLGLLGETTTRFALRELAAAAERRSDGDLRPATFEALVGVLDERSSAALRTSMRRFDEVGLVTEDSQLCRVHNWEPWCAYASRRPFLRRFVDAALRVDLLSPDRFAAALEVSGVIVTVG